MRITQPLVNHHASLKVNRDSEKAEALAIDQLIKMIQGA